MRTIFACAAVLLACAAPAQAHAVTLVLSDGTERPQPWQDWLDRSTVPTPPWRVTLHLEPCPLTDPPAAACADPFGDEKAIWTSTQSRQILHHETGHLADAYFLDDGERTNFMRVARVYRFNGVGSTWWTSARSGRNQPAEIFADTWAACSVTGRTRRLWGGDGSSSEYPPLRSLRRLCPWIGRASRDVGLPHPPESPSAR